MADTVQDATLSRALELAGGLGNLASATGVSGRHLYRALETHDIPDWLFLKVVDFINRVEAYRPELDARDVDRHAGTATRQ